MPSQRTNTGASIPSIGQAAGNVKDPGRVKIGGISPSVGPVRIASSTVTDIGKVRLGGIAPSV